MILKGDTITLGNEEYNEATLSASISIKFIFSPSSMEFIAKLYKGEDIKSDTYNKYLNDSEYEEIAQKAEITICEHNPKEFKVDEDIKIDFDLKNISTLNLSIYEYLSG